jgi:hypothetical protein
VLVEKINEKYFTETLARMNIMTTFASALKEQCDFKVKKKFSKRINEG